MSLVLDDGPPMVAAELVQADGRPGPREEVAGIENVVPERFEEAAVENVRARAGGHRDDAAGGMAVLGGVVVRDDAELLHGVDRQAGELLRAGEADGVRDIAAVEDEGLIARRGRRPTVKTG